MAMLLDSLRSAIAAVSPFGRQQALPTGILTPQAAILAYLSSGMLRKVIAVPAHDRVREWRDWQAEADQIEAIEAEERRLGLAAKVRYAEVLRGIGGGALILAAPGDPALPINVRTLAKGQLAAVNVVTRWQITGVDWVSEITDPAYGTPRMWQVSGDGRQQRIHPSRVIAFRGDPLPSIGTLGDEDAFWGDSRLVRVMREVSNADNAQGWFADLVRKAKLLRIGIGDLDDYLGSDAGRAKLQSRISLIAEGESGINATVYRLGSTAGSGKDLGEKIDDYQVTWAGIPAMMDAFDQRVAAVADIPFTRLMGRSPAGMNATGEHDTSNYDSMVAAGQNLELRPCLEQLDEVLLRSAGVVPDGIWWKFAPLTTPSEAEEADRFDKTMAAVSKLQYTATIPDVALAKAVQNLMTENGWMPGLDGALAELPEDVRFGLTAEPDGTDPSALTQEGGDPASAGGAGGDGSAPARRAANDGITDRAKPAHHEEGEAPKKRARGGTAQPQHYDPSQKRAPKGVPHAGEWVEEGRGKKAPEKQVQEDMDQPGFKPFFKGSKMVDEHGNPQPFFHGTTNDFKKFDHAHGKSNTGEEYGATDKAFYFTPNRNETHHYIELAQNRGTEIEGRVMRTYINAKNPLVLGDIRESNVDKKTLTRLLDDDEAAVAYAQKNGHDAVVWPGGNRVNSGHTVAVLHPDQIRIAGVENMAGKPFKATVASRVGQYATTTHRDLPSLISKAISREEAGSKEYVLKTAKAIIKAKPELKGAVQQELRENFLSQYARELDG